MFQEKMVPPVYLRADLLSIEGRGGGIELTPSNSEEERSY